MNEPIVKKAYYSIGDVCDLTGLKPHVLRYWETQFDILRPSKNRAGNRVYRPKDIELITLVKNLLYEQKYTIEGANQKLLEMRGDGELEEGKHEVLGPEFLASMKGELEGLMRTLTPSQPLPEETERGSETPGEESDATPQETVEAGGSAEDGSGSPPMTRDPNGLGEGAEEEPPPTGGAEEDRDLFGHTPDDGSREGL